MKVCLSTANTLAYPQGGYLWIFLNWALGLRACGCDLVWLDVASPTAPLSDVDREYRALREALRPFALDGVIALDTFGDEDRSAELRRAGLPTLDELDSFELLLDLRYDLPARLVRRYRRSALIDIDPGQLQLALAQAKYSPPPHDVFFTIGESIGPAARSTERGREWLHTFPCVALEAWPVVAPARDAPWTTIAHWWGGWMLDGEGRAFPDAKRDGFLPFLDLPSRVPARFELALNLGDAPDERRMIERHGFHVVDAHALTATPFDYRCYIQCSAGEFSCAKPSYVRLQTAWLSDRTMCYLASGRPCVVQSTGPSRLLPDDGRGLLRFTDLDDAVACMQRVIGDYAEQCRAARALAEALFDAKKVVASVLSIALA